MNAIERIEETVRGIRRLTTREALRDPSLKADIDGSTELLENLFAANRRGETNEGELLRAAVALERVEAKLLWAADCGRVQ